MTTPVDVLYVADGEGRNSVFLAGLGHRVAAFDPSSVAVEKAHLLAREKGATPQFHVAGGWGWTQPHDVVVAIFVQFAPPDLRDRMFT